MNSKTRIFIFTSCENNYFPKPIKPDFEISLKTLFLGFLVKSKNIVSDFFSFFLSDFIEIFLLIKILYKKNSPLRGEINYLITDRA